MSPVQTCRLIVGSEDGRFGLNASLTLLLFLLLFPTLALASDQAISGNIASCTSSDTATRLACQFGGLINVAIYVGYVIGTFMMLLGLGYTYLTGKKPGQYGFKPIMMTFIAGTLFLGFSHLMSIYQSFIFGEENIRNIDQYNSMISEIKGFGGSQLDAATSRTLQAIIGLIKLIGVISILHSIYLLWVIGQGSQRGYHGTSMVVFALAGTCAFRIEDFGCALGSFFNMPVMCVV